jgi:Na+/H+ antiporter nhaC
MTVKITQLNDINQLMAWRAEVLGSVFGIIPTPQLLSANRRYYKQHIDNGSHIAVIAKVNETEVGCGAICLCDELPSPDNPSGKCAYLMNIYVKELYRSNGIGHAIVQHLVQTAMRLGCDKIYLETTPRARSLYSSIGFKELNGILKYADTQHK